MRKVAYVTDIEGRWDKLLDFCAGTSLVSYDEARGLLRVAEDAVFVFGGDAIDRGPAGRKIITTLLAAKDAQPDRVVLIAGNRDVNKLRLVRELNGEPPSRVAPDVRTGPRGKLLRAILSETMGAHNAFDHRCTELIAEGKPAGDDDVINSWLEELTPTGPLSRYLASAVLGHREDETIFLHGGVTIENLGVVPKRTGARIVGVDPWIRALNEFYAESIDAFLTNRCDANGTPLWQALIEYQAPVVGTRLNQASVIYARASDDIGNPVLPPEPVVAELLASEVRRLVVGHTPSGDCPALLRDPTGFELVLADNSYGRVECGSRVTIEGHVVHVEGMTTLDSGESAPVACDFLQTDTLLGLRDKTTGRLVKAQLARGDYLTYRGLEGRRVEQIAMTEPELRRASLVFPPRRDG